MTAGLGAAPLEARRAPCASCPYRRDVPSGVWAAEEYERLPKWDGDIGDQVCQGALHVFLCHQTSAELCAGWVGHRDEPSDLLALRLGVSSGDVAASVMAYRTPVQLFGSGAEACEHGLRDLATPTHRAIRVMGKVRALQERART